MKSLAVGIFLIVIGIVMVIVGLIWYEINIKDMKVQRWFVYTLMILGGIMILVGGIMVVIHLTGKK